MSLTSLRCLVAKGAENTAGKQRGRPFAPGVSGNPAGKPQGARHKVTLAVETLLHGEAEALTRKVLEQALAGDGLSQRFCLDRIAPARKDSPISFALPPIKTAGDAVVASAALLSAVAQGGVTPEEAGRVMALLTAHRGLVETDDLELRILALEGRAK